MNECTKLALHFFSHQSIFYNVCVFSVYAVYIEILDYAHEHRYANVYELQGCPMEMSKCCLIYTWKAWNILCIYICISIGIHIVILPFHLVTVVTTKRGPNKWEIKVKGLWRWRSPVVQKSIPLFHGERLLSLSTHSW